LRATGFGATSLRRVEHASTKGYIGGAYLVALKPRELTTGIPMNLRDQLQSTLGNAYTIERELGGGGMSRVFVATEAALGRQIVVKVLPPDSAGQVSFERFKREIKLAASLQHPHIVPLLSAGESDGLPFFTMPFGQTIVRTTTAPASTAPPLSTIESCTWARGSTTAPASTI